MQVNSKNERGFSLIEILAVLALLAIILTMVAPNVIKQFQNGKAQATINQVNSLKSVLNAYYMDNGAYPSSEQGLKALAEKPSIAPVPDNWNGPYLDEGKLPKDSWNNELKYECPGKHNPEKYDLYSLGADNKEGGTGQNADVSNW